MFWIWSSWCPCQSRIVLPFWQARFYRKIFGGSTPQTEAPSGKRRRQENWDADWGGHEEECPLPRQVGWLGSVESSPSRVWGKVAGNAFWRILKTTERSCLHLCDYRVRRTNIWGAKPKWQLPPALCRTTLAFWCRRTQVVMGKTKRGR